MMHIEHALLTGTAPIVSALQSVQHAVHNISNIFISHKDLRQQVSALQSQNQHLHAQNIQLSQTLFRAHHTKPYGSAYHHYADVLQYIRFGEPLLIKAPEGESIAHNSIVLGPRGVLGRAVHVNGAFAKVITLFDANSRIPVDIQGVQGIAAGQNTTTLKLIHTKDIDTQHIKIGDLVYTSGFGGIFPKGLILGTVASLSAGEIDIAPTQTAKATPHSVAILPPISTAD